MREPGGRLKGPSLRAVGPLQRRRSTAKARGHVLLESGPLFRGDRTLKAVALLQPCPIRPDVRSKILGETDIVGEPQRIADHDVSRGEAAAAQRLGVGGRRL